MIITLCGSNRFESWFKKWNLALTLSGHTVFSLAAYISDQEGIKEWYDEETKQELDRAHFRKIDASDAIVVLNVFAYMGESTLRELAYARKTGKKVYFLESWGKGYGIGGCHYDSVRDACESFGLGRNTASPEDTMTRSHPLYHDIWSTDLLGVGSNLRSKLVQLVKEVPKGGE